jgi:amidophosphoribosyltransferase
MAINENEQLSNVKRLFADILRIAEDLPPDNGEIVRLFYQHALSVDAICYTCRISANEVNSTLTDFLTRLLRSSNHAQGFLQRCINKEKLNRIVLKSDFIDVDISDNTDEIAGILVEESAEEGSIGNRVKGLIWMALSVREPTTDQESHNEILREFCQSQQDLYRVMKGDGKAGGLDSSGISQQAQPSNERLTIDEIEDGTNKTEYSNFAYEYSMLSFDSSDMGGVFGMVSAHDAVTKTYIGLRSLQHRGQSSSGIATSDGEAVHSYRGMGSLREVYLEKEDVLKRLENDMAIGHVGVPSGVLHKIINVQPYVANYSCGQIAIALNGNIRNAQIIRDEYEAYGSVFNSTSVAEVVVKLLANPSHVAKPDTIAHVLRNHLVGAYSILFLFPDRIEAARDPHGFKPLCIGRTREGTYIVASEECAIKSINGSYIREVEPGEIVTISKSGFTSRYFIEPHTVKPAHCMFEAVYYADQASRIWDLNAYEFRKSLGGRLALEHPIDADTVIPVPYTAIPAAIGYSEKSKVHFNMAFSVNGYLDMERSQIAPYQLEREQIASLKLNCINSVVMDKRVIVVDDSIVRGTTTRSYMRALSQAGAREIHLRVSCPPIRFPCCYGMKFLLKEELVAHKRDTDQLRDFLKVDSIGYLSLKGLLECSKLPTDHFCTACWTGEYPISPSTTRNKFSMERYEDNVLEEYGDSEWNS